MRATILGVDPGLNATGFGVVETHGAQVKILEAGDIRPPAKEPLARRLEAIHRGLDVLLQRWKPRALVLEKVYTHYKHVTTAAMMAHARGVACLVAEQRGVELIEYSATRIKKCITGRGHASKLQVAGMVERWAGRTNPQSPAGRSGRRGGVPSSVQETWSFDATDALALAIAHAQMERQHQKSDLLNLGKRRIRS